MQVVCLIVTFCEMFQSSVTVFYFFSSNKWKWGNLQKLLKLTVHFVFWYEVKSACGKGKEGVTWLVLHKSYSLCDSALCWWLRKPDLQFCLPLQVVSGSGSPWKKPSKCCRATNPFTPSTCGGSSSAALPPMETPSSRAPHQTTTTPITALHPPHPRRAACWAPPADRTATQPPVLSSWDSSPKVCTVSCMNLKTFSELWLFLYV